MGGETFAQRVQNLKGSWSERRETRGIAGARDFESRFRMLVAIHGWAEEAVREIQRTYGDEVSASVSPVPTRDQHGMAFSVFLANAFSLTFALADRPKLGQSQWFISVTTGSPGGEGSAAVALGVGQRDGNWSRSRLEDLLLSVLGAWERSRFEADAHRSAGRFHTRGA